MKLKILLFPTDRQLWTDYGSESRRIRRMTASQGGDEISVPPGDYFVLATAGDLGSDWQDPETLGRLSVSADRISLRAGDQQTLNVRTRPIT